MGIVPNLRDFNELLIISDNAVAQNPEPGLFFGL